MVTQYDVEVMLRIEHAIGKKLTLFPTEMEEIDVVRERVNAAGVIAAGELRDAGKTGVKRVNKRRRGTERTRDAEGDEAEMVVNHKRSRR